MKEIMSCMCGHTGQHITQLSVSWSQAIWQGPACKLEKIEDEEPQVGVLQIFNKLTFQRRRYACACFDAAGTELCELQYGKTELTTH